MPSKISNIFSKILLLLLLVIMIAGVAVWGIHDIISGPSMKTVAKVGNSSISEREVEAAFENYRVQLMRSGLGNMNDEFKAVIKNNVIVNLIGDRLIQNEVANLNLQLDGKEVLKTDFLSMGTITKEQLKEIMLSQGGEEAFLKTIVKDKKIDFLQGSLTSIAPMTDFSANNIYSFENQKRDITYLELKPEIAKDIPAPKESELKTFYDAQKENFRTPEFRAFTYIIMDKDTVKDQGDDAASALHEFSGDVLDKISEGSTLEEISKEMGLKIKKVEAISLEGDFESGHDVEGFPKVPGFKEAVFATDEGEVSDIIESQDGLSYMIVRVDSVSPNKIKPFNEVKDLVQIGWTAQKKAERLIQISKELKEQLDAGKTTFEAFASKNGIAIKTYNSLQLNNATLSQELVSSVFNTPKNAYSPIVRNGNDALIIAKVINIKNPEKADEMKMFEYKSKLRDQVSQEIMAQYLDYLKEKYNVSVYTK